MPVFVKYLLSFLGGAALGGAISHVVTKSKMLKSNDEQMDALRKYYEEKYDVQPDEDIDISQEPVNPYVSQDVENHRIVNVQPKTRPYVEYDKMYNNSNANKEPEPTTKPLFVITPEAYGTKGFQPVTLNYYTVNEVLTDSDDSTIETEVFDMFADKIREAMPKNMIDDYEIDKIYIRDENNRIDYQIAKINTVYEGS